jgi:hypothetical protein
LACWLILAVTISIVPTPGLLTVVVLNKNPGGSGSVRRLGGKGGKSDKLPISENSIKVYLDTLGRV